ncbi:MAG: pyrroline-5-carboxylate reductase [Chloroflexota bacterium]
MFKDKKISFIGAGVMGQAMIAGIIKNELVSAKNVLAAGPRKERVDELAQQYKISPYTDNVEAGKQADVLVLAVKPQRLEHVLQELEGNIQKGSLVLSIVAGASIKKISSLLGHTLIVRAMPNTPARIGQGITVWTASNAVTADQHEFARQILSALGQEVNVSEEEFLDKATALSGTGPAYVYMFMEAMVDAGVHLGFSRRIAEQLVIETIRGSVNYYDRGDDSRHLARLRNQVTSPGGTSAEAIYYLEKAGFRTAISRAIWAAYERSVSLGKGQADRTPSDLSTD